MHNTLRAVMRTVLECAVFGISLCFLVLVGVVFGDVPYNPPIYPNTKCVAAHIEYPDAYSEICLPVVGGGCDDDDEDGLCVFGTASSVLVAGSCPEGKKKCSISTTKTDSEETYMGQCQFVEGLGCACAWVVTRVHDPETVDDCEEF